MNQAYLPPGEYKVEIQARCQNGKGDKAKFTITSSQTRDWNTLDMYGLRQMTSLPFDPLSTPQPTLVTALPTIPSAQLR